MQLFTRLSIFRPVFIVLLCFFMGILSIPLLFTKTKQSTSQVTNKHTEKEVAVLPSPDFSKDTRPLYWQFSQSPREYVSTANDRYNAADVFYLKNIKNIHIPSLLSEYSFVSIHTGPYNYMVSSSVLSAVRFRVAELYSDTQLTGLFFDAPDSSVWLQAEITKSVKDPRASQKDTVIAHGKTREEITSMLKELGTLEQSQYPTLTGFRELPKRRMVRANTTHPTGKYIYYLPGGMKTEFSTPIQGERYGNTSFEHTSKTYGFCAVLSGIHDDPSYCTFSTSGATCANTGCSLVDYVMYGNLQGDVVVDDLVHIGIIRRPDDTDTPRFGISYVYGSQSPWVVASFSSDLDHYDHILDFIPFVQSIDRTY